MRDAEERAMSVICCCQDREPLAIWWRMTGTADDAWDRVGRDIRAPVRAFCHGLESLLPSHPRTSSTPFLSRRVLSCVSLGRCEVPHRLRFCLVDGWSTPGLCRTLLGSPPTASNSIPLPSVLRQPTMTNGAMRMTRWRPTASATLLRRSRRMPTKTLRSFKHPSWTQTRRRPTR